MLGSCLLGTWSLLYAPPPTTSLSSNSALCKIPGLEKNPESLLPACPNLEGPSTHTHHFSQRTDNEAEFLLSHIKNHVPAPEHPNMVCFLLGFVNHFSLICVLAAD